MAKGALIAGCCSLGEFVRALAPGSPCPWCGTPLRSAATRLQPAGSEGAGRGEGASEVELGCPRCGSEVGADDEDLQGRRCASLWVAA